MYVCVNNALSYHAWHTVIRWQKTLNLLCHFICLNILSRSQWLKSPGVSVFGVKLHYTLLLICSWAEQLLKEVRKWFFLVFKKFIFFPPKANSVVLLVAQVKSISQFYIQYLTLPSSSYSSSFKMWFDRKPGCVMVGSSSPYPSCLPRTLRFGLCWRVPGQGSSSTGLRSCATWGLCCSPCPMLNHALWLPTALPAEMECSRA